MEFPSSSTARKSSSLSRMVSNASESVRSSASDAEALRPPPARVWIMKSKSAAVSLSRQVGVIIGSDTGASPMPREKSSHRPLPRSQKTEQARPRNAIWPLKSLGWEICLLLVAFGCRSCRSRSRLRAGASCEAESNGCECDESDNAHGINSHPFLCWLRSRYLCRGQS